MSPRTPPIRLVILVRSIRFLGLSPLWSGRSITLPLMMFRHLLYQDQQPRRRGLAFQARPRTVQPMPPRWVSNPDGLSSVVTLNLVGMYPPLPAGPERVQLRPGLKRRRKMAGSFKPGGEGWMRNPTTQPPSLIRQPCTVHLRRAASHAAARRPCGMGTFCGKTH